MQMKKYLSIILLPSLLTSCQPPHFYLEPFMVLETDDGSFMTLPSYRDGYFYAYLTLNNEKTLVYCTSKGGPIQVWNNRIIEPYPQYIYTEIESSKIDCVVTIYSHADNTLDWVDLSNWKVTGKRRESEDIELDAKYYAATNFRGLDGDFYVLFKPGKFGYLDSDRKRECDYIYLGDSSIFSFTLIGKYKEKPVTFTFLDNHEFIIKADNEDKKITGTYTSSRTGMTLHIIENEIFDTDSVGVELEAYSSSYYYTQTIPQDLNKYINK